MKLPYRELLYFPLKRFYHSFSYKSILIVIAHGDYVLPFL